MESTSRLVDGPARSTEQRLVSVGTTLSDALALLDEAQRHLLIVDGDALIGVVSADAIHEKLDCQNAVERRRWESAPIESVLSMPLGEPRRAGSSSGRHRAIVSEISCQSHIVGERLVAVSTEDDLFVSWSEVAPILDRAAIDPVTRLPRRSQFERTLRREVERAHHHGTALAVLLVDIDHFKRVNDLCGHALGDAVLYMVAHCLKGGVRSDDFVARYAGDEFVVICPGCDPDRINMPIERIQKSIDQLSVPNDMEGLRITLSLGGVVGCPLEPSVSPSELMDLADHCLYTSKRSGRNCAHHLILGSADRELIRTRTNSQRASSTNESSMAR